MSFFDRMRKVMSEGFDTTRDLLGSAAERAKELGEKGVLRYEISRLERDTEKRFAQLGNKIYQLFGEKDQKSVTRDNTEVAALVEEIAELEKRIKDKEDALGKIP
jgi:hypothetical protein